MHKHEPLGPTSTSTPSVQSRSVEAERAEDCQARAQARLHNISSLTLAGGKPNRTLHPHHTVISKDLVRRGASALRPAQHEGTEFRPR
jgi:hypothetical protein